MSSTPLVLTGSAQAALVQQINQDNNKTFTIEQLNFGPVMTNGGPDAAEYEAAVLVTGIPAQGFSGSFVYKYNRIDLDTIFNTGNSSYSVDSCNEYSDLVALINTAMGTNMAVTVLPNSDVNQLYVPGDVSPALLPAPTPAAPKVSFILTADLNSYLYRGAAVLVATTAAVSLATAFTVPSTGLTYTPPA